VRVEGKHDASFSLYCGLLWPLNTGVHSACPYERSPYLLVVLLGWLPSLQTHTLFSVLMGAPGSHDAISGAPESSSSHSFTFFGSIIYHSIYVCMPVGFCLIFVNCVFLLLCLCILIVMYDVFCVFVSLCCSVYCLCVNVYCTTATECQPSCS
jgi:hypothetical protein